MKVYPTHQRGVTTLTLLMLLSSILTLLMLFNDDILRLHSSLVAQRMQYIRQHSHLQTQSQQQKDIVCETLSVQEEGNEHLITFGNKDGNKEGLRQFIWCERQKLFKDLPKTAVNAERFEQFILQDNIVAFNTRFMPPPMILPKDKSDYFYWFNATQTHWELNGHIYAVIVAEGDLHITGKGRISGAVITKGQLIRDEGVQIAYRKTTVNAVDRLYSRWRRAEKSWHDFVLH